MDLPAVKNAKLALDTLKLIKFPFEKMKLVLNRVNSKARLDIGELERSLGLEVQAAISHEGTPDYKDQQLLHWRDEAAFFQVTMQQDRYFFGGAFDLQMRATSVD